MLHLNYSSLANLDAEEHTEPRVSSAHYYSEKIIQIIFNQYKVNFASFFVLWQGPWEFDTGETG